MRAFISRLEQLEFYKSLDNIHDPSIYEMKPGETPWVEVNTFQMNFTKEEENNATIKLATAPIFKWRPPLLHNQERIALKNKINASFAEIREESQATNSSIIPRTQAHNRKCSATTMEEEQAMRAETLAEQIKAWRSLLPSLLKQFGSPRIKVVNEYAIITA